MPSINPPVTLAIGTADSLIVLVITAAGGTAVVWDAEAADGAVVAGAEPVGTSSEIFVLGAVIVVGAFGDVMTCG